jgi:hypothetical protein
VTSTGTTTGTPDALEVPVVIGGPSRTRTLDPLITSCPEPRTQDTQSDPSVTNHSDPDQLDVFLDRPGTGCSGSRVVAHTGQHGFESPTGYVCQENSTSASSPWPGRPSPREVREARRLRVSRA